MVRIATCICIDTDENDANILYRGLSSKPLASDVRRTIYWRLVTTFCCSSIRCNPNEDHYVYTNDPDEIIIDRINIKKFLKKIGVKIIILPFQKFVPLPEHCKSFKNAFYKLEVIAKLGTNEDAASLLVDSDCLWHKYNEKLLSTINSDNYILLRDTYEVNDYWIEQPHHISRAGMGNVYSEINSNYPTPYPIWYGGEFIGGRGRNLQTIARELIVLIDDLRARNLNPPMSKIRNLFDNEEYVSNFAYNKKLVNIYESKEFIKRIYTTGRDEPKMKDTAMQESTYNVTSQDFNIPIWHLPGEKQNGLQFIFQEAINPRSKFWKVPLNEFTTYLGRYVGIPERRKDLAFKRMFSKAKNGVKKSLLLAGFTD